MELTRERQKVGWNPRERSCGAYGSGKTGLEGVEGGGGGVEVGWWKMVEVSWRWKSDDGRLVES